MRIASGQGCGWGGNELNAEWMLFDGQRCEFRCDLKAPCIRTSDFNDRIKVRGTKSS